MHDGDRSVRRPCIHPVVTILTKAKEGDVVRVHYTGTLGDGSEFDSSRGRDPLEFTLGSGQVIPGFEAAVSGLAPGESCRTEIPAEDAYGPHRPELVTSVERAQMPDHIDLSVGGALQVTGQDGQPFTVQITEVTEEAVQLDANHPLAGETLVFDLELTEIV